jgi:large subunit ribosomal protein L25
MIDIQVKKREIFGKRVKTLRSEGLIPAELYGHKIENAHLSVPVKEFSKLYKAVGESTVINLILDGKKMPALIHDVSIDALSDQFSHVDFYAVNMDEKIKTAIPLSFIGEAPAIKIGGVLVKSMKELEVEALPGDLPQHIDVDLSTLVEIHNSIHVKDLDINAKKVKIFIDPEAVVATIIEMAKEEEVVKPVTVEDVKVEGEEKKKEAAAAKEAEGKK